MKQLVQYSTQSNDLVIGFLWASYFNIYECQSPYQIEITVLPSLAAFQDFSEIIYVKAGR